MPLLDVGAAVRELPSSRSMEKAVLPAGQATVAAVLPGAEYADGEHWRFITAGNLHGWVRETDVRMIPVSVTASELADEIYSTVSEAPMLDAMLK